MKLKMQPFVTEEENPSIKNFVTKGLDPNLVAMFYKILRTQWAYVDNDVFYRRNAYSNIFERGESVSAERIKETETTWHKVLANVKLEGAEVIVKENSKNHLLTKEEEQTLFLRYNYARYRVYRILLRLQKRRLSQSEAHEAVRWAQIAYRHQDILVTFNLGLVMRVIQYKGLIDSCTLTDFVDESNMALLRSVDSFDASKGFKFSSYAWRALTAALTRAGDKINRNRRVPLFRSAAGNVVYAHRKNLFNEATQFNSDYNVNLVTEKSFDHDLKALPEIYDLATTLRDCPALLSEVEATILIKRFYQDKTLKKIADEISLSREMVRKYQNSAIEKLREELTFDPNKLALTAS